MNNLFQSETPHFFKVILKDDIRKGNLRIPKKFVQNHGSGLSDVVRLEVPSGRVWEVELQRDDEDLFLQNGWADFVLSCCISFGYFVVFRHEGYSRFHVVVFDVTACEVKYPANPGTAKKPGSRNTRPCSLPELGRTPKGGVQMIEISADKVLDSTQKIGGKKPLLHCPRPSKRSRDVSPGTDCSASELQFRNSMDERRDVGRGEAVKRARPAAKSGAFLRASSYKCEKPSTIVIVRSRRGLYLPLNFWMTCFPDGISDIKVCVSERKIWRIHANNSKYPKFRLGWRKFLADNNLTEGDVCLFEVMASAEPAFRVVLFRKGDVARMPNDTVDLEGNDEVGRKNPLSWAVTGETSATDPIMNGSSRLVSQCQCHSVASHKVQKTSEEKIRVEELNEDEGSDVLTDSNRKNHPSYCRFLTSDMRVQTEEPTGNENLNARMSSDRERPPLFFPRSSKRLGTISKGIDAPMITSIRSSQLQEPTERHHLGKSAEFDIRAAGDENSGTLQRVSSLLSENPSCIVVIRSMKHLYFPINFLTTCFPGGRETFGDIKVCVPGKGSWLLGINKERYPKFFKGWKEFVADNELRIGHVCMFELMRSADVDFQFVKFDEEDEIAAHIRPLLRSVSQGSSKILINRNANEFKPCFKMFTKRHEEAFLATSRSDDVKFSRKLFMPNADQEIGFIETQRVLREWELREQSLLFEKECRELFP